jgi:drug/metabolite transporter (DMT)-like permease
VSRASSLRLLVLALVWGSGFFFIAIALRGFSAVQITFARLLLGAAVLVCLVLIRRGRLPRQRTLWLHLTVAALLANAIPYTLFALAQERLPSGVAGVINATTPLWTLVCEMAVGNRRPGVTRLAGLAVGFAGTVLIFAPWGSGAAAASWAGLAALVASACYGLAYVYQHRYLTGSGHPPLVLAAGQMIAASGLMAFTLPWGGFQTIHPRADAILALLTLGAIATGAGYVLNFRLIADEGPASSIVSYLIPVVAVVLGWLVLGEALHLGTLLGVLVVLTGVAFTQRQPKSRRSAP